MARKRRLDLHLLTLGLASSRQQAQQLIRAGKVRDVHGQRLEKPGQEISEAAELRVEQPPRFVSRGGEKLLGALEAFPVTVADRVCLDGGISTGGFTDCLLQHGASRVYGIDVGYGQTAWSLRTDERVVLRERTNLRRLTAAELYEQGDPRPTLAVATSFISGTGCRPCGPDGDGWPQASSCEAIVLVKPSSRWDVSGRKGGLCDPRPAPPSPG